MTLPHVLSVPPHVIECADEPIRVPGSVQPHGFLLVLDRKTHCVVQASSNTPAFLGREADSLLGKPLASAVGDDAADALLAALAEDQTFEPRFLQMVVLQTPSGEQTFEVVGHVCSGGVILELQPAVRSSITFQGLYPHVRKFINSLNGLSSVQELGDLAAREIRSLTGFDRVLVYRFDEGWNGHVVAEARSDDFPSYQDLWFPASDIPPQARELYVLNRFRLIANVDYKPAPLVPSLNPATQEALDMTYSGLRSVSPVHLENLRNMQVGASMSISVVTQEAKLWGLIACHHRTSRVVPVETRFACDLLAQALSIQVQAVEQRQDIERRLQYSRQIADLLAFMSQEDEFMHGLTKHPAELLSFADASGAAVLCGGECITLGETPSGDEISALVDHLISRGQPEIFHTDRLSAEFPEAATYAAVASGLLATAISKLYPSYILWFRREVVQTVKWSGDPNRSMVSDANGAPQLHTRKSFETWKEIVKAASLPWDPALIEAASSLRNAIVGVVLRKAEELAGLSEELKRSNRELEAFSYSVSHDLRAPFRHIVGYGELLRKSPTAKLGGRDLRFVETIIQSAQFAGTLVDNLLSFSQVGRAQLRIRLVHVDKIVQELQRSVQIVHPQRRIEWRVAPLGEVYADPVLLRIVWQNLIDNAVKFTASVPHTVIEIGVERKSDRSVFFIRDNGVGFENQYANKLFGVFQRLHRMEDFEGTGIGLANVRRIVTRHAGETWAEGKVNQGATFYFSIPNQPIKYSEEERTGTGAI
jgi:light-regulated signal transduction histidine kinase (bacteriophytochrome)